MKTRTNKSDLPHFAARFRELRERSGLSRRELGTAAGTSDSAIAMLERGERSPSLELAGRLADALGVSTDTLRGAPGDPVGRQKKIAK